MPFNLIESLKIASYETTGYTLKNVHAQQTEGESAAVAVVKVAAPPQNS